MRKSVMDSSKYFTLLIARYSNFQTVILVYILLFSERKSRLMWIQNGEENSLISLQL